MTKPTEPGPAAPPPQNRAKQRAATQLREFVGRPDLHGSDPDYRFTLANERTLLAWIRTALALVAGGLGALHLLPPSLSAEIAGVLLLTLAVVVATSSYRRWFRTENAIRLGEPLPKSRLPVVLAYSVSGLGLVAALLFIFGV